MDNKNGDWFVRVLIVVLSFLIGAMIFYNFFITAPVGEISNGLIALLILLILLILSEAFDNIALGKILSLNRKIEEKRIEVSDLKSEKQNLLNMLVKNISFQSQSVGISGHDLKEILTVIKADPERIEQETKEKEANIEDEQLYTIQKPKRINFRKVERHVLNSFIETNKLQGFLFYEQVTFSKNYATVDPISTLTPIFDGYIETENTEIFIEVKLQRVVISFREQLYSRLSALYHYREAKKVNAYLQLILVELPEDEKMGKIRNTEERFRDIFEPAIEKKLLKIKYVKLTSAETKGLYR